MTTTQATSDVGVPAPRGVSRAQRRSMLGEMFGFELRYQMRLPSNYVLTAALFLVALLLGSIPPRAIRPPLVYVNSPYVVLDVVLIVTAIGQILTPGIAGMATVRDAQYRMRELFFTTPLGKRDYLGGRLLGVLVVSLGMYAAVPLGAAAGAFMPWVERSSLAPFSPALYVHAYLFTVVPSVVIFTAIFLALGALMHNELVVYAQGVALFIAWSISVTLLGSLGGMRVGALLDVFGLSTFDYATRYWTLAEKNARLLSLGGIVLENRALWIAISIGALAVTYVRFSRTTLSRSTRWRLGVREEGTVVAHAERAEPASIAPPPAAALVAATHRRVGAQARVRQMVSIARFTFARIIKDKAFVIVAALGLVNAATNAWYAGRWYDTPMYPVTGEVAAGMLLGSQAYFLIVAVIYAGELAWRERQMRANELLDALSVPTATLMTGKLLGLIAAEGALLFVFMLAGMAVQLLKGYHHFEVVVYLRFLYGVQFPSVVAVTLLAFAVHSVVNHKYVGHLLVIVWYVATESFSKLGLEHQLWSYGHWAPFAYSQMNGFGAFVPNLVWLALCWLASGVLLGVVAALFWVRGHDLRWRTRLRDARARATVRAGAVAGLGAGAALCAGGVVFYNTNVLNTYRTSRQRDAMAAAYEITYRRYQLLPQPRLVGTQLRVDLYPDRRAYTFAGVDTYVNRAGRPLDTLFVQMDRSLGIASLVWSRPASRVSSDSPQGVFVYRLAQALAPADTVRLAYGVHYQARGFPNATPHTTIAANGTVLNPDIVSAEPRLGYQRYLELTSADARKAQHLPRRQRSLPVTTPVADRYDDPPGWATFDAVVSTAPDQIAIAPGQLVKQWTEGGRRMFHYHAYGPVLAGASVVLSARYAVRTANWRAPGGGVIPIQIYYDPGHPYNVNRLIDAVQRSLTYYTDNFGPYQFRQLRIAEVPNDSSYAAASGPNTILFTERGGFLMRVADDGSGLDMPSLVTAHEVSHQWWGGQVAPSRVQGAAMLTESLAEYSALMVMEHQYGRDAVHTFLRHELDRYLVGRSREAVREMPLALAENGQGYICYNKGALAFYALRDYLGEQQVDAVLRAFVARHRFQGPPFPASQELVDDFRDATPDSLRQVVTDLFETITLFDLRAEEATAVRRPDGRYDVRLVLRARKLRADTLGRETSVPMDDYVDVGVFGAREKGNALGAPLFLSKFHVTAPSMTVTVTVNGRPERAGIDPYNKLIDRAPDDNVLAVEMRR